MTNIHTPTQVDIITALENRGYTADQAVDAIRVIKADALRDAAFNLRNRPWTVYENGSTQTSDGHGNDGHTIDSWYADHLDERAVKVEKNGRVQKLSDRSTRVN